MGRSNEIVEVTLQFMKETASAMAFFQGDTEEDPETGEVKDVWIWLPKSQITCERGDKNFFVVSLPEWLGLEKGLI